MGCFLEYNGRFVVLRRHSHKPDGGTWGLAGGKVGPGEEEGRHIFVAYRVKLSQPHQVRLEDAAHSEYRWVTVDECYAIPNLIPHFHRLLELLGGYKIEAR